MKNRGSTGIWGLIIVITLVSGILGWTRLAGLPDLEMLLGPDLTVRHVAMEGSTTTDGQPFQRGDVLRAVSASSEWHTLDDLEELRAVVPLLLAEAEPPEFDDQSDGEVDAGDRAEGVAVLEYQLFRPVHRFSLALQGEVIDPTELPPGVQGEDRLVEVDGRLLPDKMGPEGIRSVAASRPDAVLGFERPDAIFFGQLEVETRAYYPGIVLAFLLVLAAIGVLWRWHTDAVGPRAAYFIAVETLCLGWLVMLVFAFQWVLADQLLAAGVIVGLVMMRPLAIFGREQTGLDAESGGAIALGIGALVSVVLIGLMTSGVLESPEETLHAAAIVAGLFIIYELAASGIEGDSMLSLGDRGGYLAGVVVLGLFACVVAMVMEPVAFEEDRWRWFAVSILSLMWFGDTLYAVKFGSRSAMGEIADRRSRDKLVRRYLREMALEMPHTDLRIVGTIDGGASVQLTLDKDQIRRQITEAALLDAVEILINENARVPLPEGVDRQSHPMAGIAQAMNISIAVQLMPPTGSLLLDDNQVSLALVGMRESSDGDIPSYASSQTLDRAQELWTGPVASAATIEVVAGFFLSGASLQVAGEASPALRRKLEEAKEAAVECQEERASLVEEKDRLGARFEQEKRQTRLRQLAASPGYPAPIEEQDLLEAELIGGLEYLLETPEPVVFGGRVGTGKGFVAHWAHFLDEAREDDFLVVDTGASDAAMRLDEILGEGGGGTGPGLLEDFDGGLLIRGAQRCDDGRILALCHQCEELGVRLYLSFESKVAERESVLEERPASLQELLGHREVVIPRFARRPKIRNAVLNYWLGEWSTRYDKGIDGFSRLAMEVLQAYHYPGDLAEAVEVVRLAVVDADHDVVDCENLPMRVQEAKPGF